MPAKDDVVKFQNPLEEIDASQRTPVGDRGSSPETLDGPPQSPAVVAMKEMWLMLTAPGNAVAGVAAAMHVNIYLLALALILSTPYLPTMECMQMAAVGTISLQVPNADSFS